MTRSMTNTISFSEGASPGNLRPAQTFSKSVKSFTVCSPIEHIAQTWHMHRLVSVFVCASDFFIKRFIRSFVYKKKQ